MVSPLKIRPLDGWCVVLADPRKDVLASGIILPGSDTVDERMSEGAGTIIKVGQGKKNGPLSLRRGDRIAYRGFLKHAVPLESDDFWPNSKQRVLYFLISTDDILGVLADGVDVGVFSGRPSNPELVSGH